MSNSRDFIAQPSISISGNARVIVGDVHGLDPEFLSHAARAERKRTLRQSLSDTTEQAGERLLLVSSELSVLTLRDYEYVKSTITKLRHYEARAETYAKRIGVRQSIFRTSLLTLLVTHVGIDLAQEMLADSQHAMWLNQEFLSYLRDRFGANLDAIQNVLELISLDVDAISALAEKCMLVKAENNKENSLTSIKQVHHFLRSRIRHIMNEERLEEHIGKLRDNTDDFRTLLQQCYVQKEHNHTSIPTGQTKIKIGRYRRVQEAAGNLYHAFGLACTKHTKHQAHLRVHADSADPSQVQFTLLLKHSGYLASKPFPESDPSTLRLTVESQVVGTFTGSKQPLSIAGIASSLSTCRKRSRDPEQSEGNATLPTSKVKKKVGFGNIRGLALPDTKFPDTLPNFCRHSNFCTHVQHLLSQGCQRGHPLGYLDSKGCSKHLIYLSSQTQTISFQASEKQFLTTFRQLYHEADHRLSRTEIIVLSKQLATAVLQYHTTPWLEDSWNSDHVLVDADSKHHASVGLIDHRKSRPQFDSYLDVSIHNPSEVLQSPITSRSRTLIRNWTLYSLGVMLLELAYRRPIQEMRKSQDIDVNEHNTNYYTADRIQQNVSQEMGIDFAEIVRKCIQCDFGYGADLSLTKLQEGFYEDVVQKLEDIETKFKDMGF